jgi:hypothetical protein
MIRFKVYINCNQCNEPATVEPTEYILYLIHRYLFFMDIGLYCEDCL